MEFPPAPKDMNLSDSAKPQLYAAFITTYVLACAAISLRIVCRKTLSNAGLWWDDWAVIIGMVFATGNFIAMLVWVSRGLGTHIYLYGWPGVTNFLSTLFGIEILYTLSIVLTKYSILLFYWRIFGKNIKIPAYVIAVLVTGWGLGVILTTIFQCLPVRAFWDKSITTAKCGVNVNNFFIGNAVPNILTDWALLILPLPFVWRLHRNAVQKLALCGVFLCGGFICIISIIRLAIMLNAYKDPTNLDVTWEFIGPSTWTAVEVNIGIVSACLPSLRPLIGSASKIGSSAKKYSGGSSGYGSSGYNSTDKSWPRNKRSDFYRDAEALQSADNQFDHDMAHINVKTTIDVNEERAL